jgi:hypothetical protein
MSHSKAFTTKATKDTKEIKKSLDTKDTEDTEDTKEKIKNMSRIVVSRLRVRFDAGIYIIRSSFVPSVTLVSSVLKLWLFLSVLRVLGGESF